MTQPTKVDVDRDLAVLKHRAGTPARAKAEQQPTVQRPPRRPDAMPGSVAAGGPQRRTEGRTGPTARVEYR